MHRASVIIVSLVLLFCGALKIATPTAIFGFAQEWSFVLGALEVVGAVIVWTKWAASGFMLSAFIACGGGAIALWVPENRCGCLGSEVRLDANQHLMLASILGFWACIGLLVRAGSGVQLATRGVQAGSSPLKGGDDA